MKHLNGDKLCVIDTETTGKDPSKHHIWDICVIALDDKLEIDKTVRPFQAMMRPDSAFEQGALKCAGLSQAEIINSGLDPFKVADYFEDWFKKLNLPQGKKIVPLAHNWPFDREFLIEWLGRLSFNHYFSGEYRDTFQLVCFHNDRKWFKSDPYEYAKKSLGALAQRLNLDISGLHRATSDCLLTIEVYRKLIRDGLF